MANFTTAANGQLIATSGPPLHTGFTQNISGSPVEAAASKTITSQQTAAAAAKSLGAGQKAGANLNVRMPAIPEAGTIPGVSHSQNHINAINTLNQLRANGVYDSQINATPIQLGGRNKYTILRIS